MAETISKSVFSGDKNFDYDGTDLEYLEDMDNLYNMILSKFDDYIGENLLEVGAGIGTFSKSILNRYNKNLIAIEPSKMINKLKQSLAEEISTKKITPLSGFLNNNLQNLKKIDTIFYNNVLEHIKDDEIELQIAYDVLQPGGHILTYTPANPSLYCEMDQEIGHYRRYTLFEMKGKMQKAGFVIKEGYYHDFVGMILMYIKYKILKMTKLSKKNVSLYFNTILPLLDKIEPSRLLPNGKNIFVIAQKPL
ncbi:MAG: class I SAM-dependent methyltransferase [candidate division SR1 bacterium]|nr:class I SAM-dependent methyltransferase [candidate division SR1 bacterium]